MRYRVLLVDDREIEVREIISELRRDFDVVFADNAEKGLSLFNEEGFDVVILDVMMESPPSMIRKTRWGLDTGLWVLGEIRDRAIERGVFIMMLTNGEVEYIQEQVAKMDFPPKTVETRSKLRSPPFFLRNYFKEKLGASNLEASKGAPEYKAPTPLDRRNNSWIEFNASETAIVFVHGLNSSSAACWLNSKNKAYWPDLVLSDPEFFRPSVFIAGYPADVSAGEFEVYDAAQELFARFRSKISGFSAIMDKPKILFVCHSQGGIVIRQLLSTNVKAFKGKKVGVLLCASPGWGSRWATIMRPFASLLRMRQLCGLVWESSMLLALDRAFLQMIEEKEIHELCGASLIETRGLYGLPKIVSAASATRYFNKWYRIPKANHSDVVKPNNHEHPSHLHFRSFAKDHGFVS